MTERCDFCNRRLDRPPDRALLFVKEGYGCHFPARHTAPTLVQKIVERIELDLCDRQGLKHTWERVDPDVLDEIRDAWAMLIERELTSQT